MKLKTLTLSVLLAMSSTLALAEPASPPAADRGPGAPAKKLHSSITVQSIKPTLTKRHVFSIRGTHANGVEGDWTLASDVGVNEAAAAIHITLTGTAPQGSRLNRSVAPFQATVEVPFLDNRVGKFDVIVVDKDGKELARTVYEKSAPKA